MNLLLRLLGEDHRELIAVIDEREKRRGFASVDAELVGELYDRRTKLMGELGLDVGDTTAEELYYALRVRWQREKDEEVRKKFWREYQYLGVMLDGELVSANGKDVEENLGRDFAERSLEGFRKGLVKEIKRRYGLK
ncbi:hypothetical protein FWD07_01305 [Candidatus Saccharibacteria bacterium]|nr:hypothetical protein [Candidatus Saccharibacteria bacterium]